MSVALAESMHDAGELVRRYAVQGPRYTSYPTALNFRDDFGVADYDAFLKEARRSPSPLSLYVHVPFCHSPLLLLRLQQSDYTRPQCQSALPGSSA